ncbi:MAG TPA: OB-fold nucleic acid binding domain-containing protein [Candidatus Paceibacterota bacterium]|nr:OB-fold nucleic acid binding domain-containing protein [Candidatus Paceibacterota bacterium]
MADFKRQTAYKIRIGDVLKGKPIVDNGRFMFLELGDRKISRVNIVANIIDKYNSAEKQYISFTIDDASGQLRIKVFGDDVLKFSEISQGDTVMVIGLLRVFNEELYITPEIIKPKDTRYLLVRKLELEKEAPKVIDKEQILVLADQILEKIKQAEPEGISYEKIIMEINSSSPDLINQEIKKALEQGIVYEPRPGMLRYLGN